MTTYLYIKTHNKTGLKYLGKTTSSNPHTYPGSGTKWRRHLDKHGYDYTTEILKECQTKEEVKEWGLYYSNLWNVVDDNSWANLRPETGDGGDTSMCENFQKWIPIMKEMSKKKRWWNNGIHQVHSEFPPDDSYIKGRHSFNNVGAQIGANIQKNKKWYNNGVDNKMFMPGQEPDNWIIGRLGAFSNRRKSAKGTSWWNNGTEEKMSINSPGPSFVRGRILKTR